MSCICQRAYDTGFTGITRVDRRLAHHYEVYGEDCLRRSYDHYHFGVPYTDAPRRHYCFVSRTQTVCAHEACEHARYRPPTYVAKMRFYIESICTAATHYPELEDRSSVPELASSGGIEYATAGVHEKWGTPLFLRRTATVRDHDDAPVAEITCLQSRYVPPSDRAIEERERWEDEMHRLHRQIGYRERTPRLTAIPVERFREELTTALTDISLDAGTLSAEAFEEVAHELNEWSDEMTADQEVAYWEAVAI